MMAAIPAFMLINKASDNNINAEKQENGIEVEEKVEDETTVSEKEAGFKLNHCLYFLSTDAGIKSKHSLYHKGFLESLGLRPESRYQFTLHSDYKYKNLSH